MFHENPIVNRRQNKEFFRAGPTTNWRKKLPKKILVKIEKTFNKEMLELGYL